MFGGVIQDQTEQAEKKVEMMLQDTVAAVQMVISTSEFLGCEEESPSLLVFLLGRVSWCET